MGDVIWRIKIAFPLARGLGYEKSLPSRVGENFSLAQMYWLIHPLK